MRILSQRDLFMLQLLTLVSLLLAAQTAGFRKFHSRNAFDKTGYLTPRENRLVNVVVH